MTEHQQLPVVQHAWPSGSHGLANALGLRDPEEIEAAYQRHRAELSPSLAVNLNDPYQGHLGVASGS